MKRASKASTVIPSRRASAARRASVSCEISILIGNRLSFSAYSIIQRFNNKFEVQRAGEARCSRVNPGNRLRADIVAAAYGAQRFAVHIAPLDRLALLVRGELRLTPEFDALRLRVGAAPCRSLFDAAIFQLRGNAKD